jgi:hypothetical protein
MWRPLACHIGEKGIFECVFKQKWQICRCVSNNGFRAGAIRYNGKNVKSPLYRGGGKGYLVHGEKKSYRESAGENFIPVDGENPST